MDHKPVLIVMAAGMGSRYGGLKQIDPVSDEGEIIMDFSIYDAIRAGFETVIFVIRRAFERDFKKIVGARLEKYADVRYVYQRLEDLPEGYAVPEGRVKPWGTGHAVLCCRHVVSGPFAVINADDYYGPEAFGIIYDYLASVTDDDGYRFAMVGYPIENTLTDFGYVSRGVCRVGEDQMLIDICERTHIEKRDGRAVYTEDDGRTWHRIPAGSTVSMNMWGFSTGFMDELERRFIPFLDETLRSWPQKGEYFLPNVVDELVRADRATVRVLRSHDRWYGVTYKEDRAVIADAIAQMKAAGMYPRKLWS